MDNIFTDLKYHFSINKRSYLVLFGVMLLFALISFLYIKATPEGDMAALVILLGFPVFGIPIFGLNIVIKSHKENISGLRSFVFSILNHTIIITLIYLLIFWTLFHQFTETSDLFSALVFPMYGVIILLVLSYLYFELVLNFEIIWKAFIIRTAVFTLYFPIYIIIHSLISVENVSTLATILSIIFLFDITIHVTLKYYKGYYTVK